MTKQDKVYVLKHPTAVMPAMEGAVFVDWLQICHLRRLVYVKFEEYRQTSKHQCVERKRKYLVCGRDGHNYACCSNLAGAMKVARELLGLR